MLLSELEMLFQMFFSPDRIGHFEYHEKRLRDIALFVNQLWATPLRLRVTFSRREILLIYGRMSHIHND